MIQELVIRCPYEISTRVSIDFHNYRRNESFDTWYEKYAHPLLDQAEVVHYQTIENGRRLSSLHTVYIRELGFREIYSGSLGGRYRLYKSLNKKEKCIEFAFLTILEPSRVRTRENYAYVQIEKKLLDIINEHCKIHLRSANRRTTSNYQSLLIEYSVKYRRLKAKGPKNDNRRTCCYR